MSMTKLQTSFCGVQTLNVLSSCTQRTPNSTAAFPDSPPLLCKVQKKNKVTIKRSFYIQLRSKQELGSKEGREIKLYGKRKRNKAILTFSQKTLFTNGYKTRELHVSFKLGFSLKQWPQLFTPSDAAKALPNPSQFEFHQETYNHKVMDFFHLLALYPLEFHLSHLLLVILVCGSHTKCLLEMLTGPIHLLPCLPEKYSFCWRSSG